MTRVKIFNQKNLRGTGVALVIAFAAWLPTTARAADETKPMKPMKGGEHMLMLQGLVPDKRLLFELEYGSVDCSAVVIS